ncbi:HAD family hydrolase [Rhodobaculum claviforme]|uniref:phosphoglycolate phosphatase n=1 Tax=Rhodobaculum claviforme TaxID=1549854 RepID=A0A934WKE5_9RHOB|nr:HAD-IA family hydrolase [Rhodobaculum claviforme]MBK5928784.1 phosphatase [Rhodobaculum claviforme]
MGDILGVIFDKDGTLYDFEATWGAWTRDLIAALSDGDGGLAARLAAAIGFDTARGCFDPASPVIAGTSDEAADLIAPLLPQLPRAALIARMSQAATAAPLVEAAPLAPLLAGLRGRGLRLGVATNDTEASARAHLASSGVGAAFDFIAGFDSGYGAKPGPGMLLGFADAMGLAPGAVVMVGDSRHDLLAGRAAGMRTLGVLTGPARTEALAPLADAVLPDIGHLPGWLDRRAG